MKSVLLIAFYRFKKIYCILQIKKIKVNSYFKSCFFTELSFSSKLSKANIMKKKTLFKNRVHWKSIGEKYYQV